jgi:hypothetical protein
MATIPNGSYAVTVKNPDGTTNTTASGTLVVTSNPTNPVTYNFSGPGSPVNVTNYNGDTTDVSWTATRASNNFTYNFSAGVYDSTGRGSISGGGVNVPSVDRSQEDLADTWTATAEGSEEDVTGQAYGARATGAGE